MVMMILPSARSCCRPFVRRRMRSSSNNNRVQKTNNSKVYGTDLTICRKAARTTNVIKSKKQQQAILSSAPLKKSSQGMIMENPKTRKATLGGNGRRVYPSFCSALFVSGCESKSMHGHMNRSLTCGPTTYFQIGWLSLATTAAASPSQAALPIPQLIQLRSFSSDCTNGEMEEEDEEDGR